MHVGGLQLFKKPDGAGPDYLRDVRRSLLESDNMRSVFRRRPARPVNTMGHVAWTSRNRSRARLPLPALGAAAAGPHPRAAGADVTLAQHPARPAPAAVGDPPHRGARRRPVRRLHEGPPRADGRRLGAAPAAGHAVGRPDGSGLPAVVGQPAQARRRPRQELAVVAADRRQDRQPARRAGARRDEGRAGGVRRAHGDPAGAGAEDDVQRADRRRAAVRGAVVVARTRPEGGHRGRGVAQRRRARDVLGRAAGLPHRAARAAGRAARRDGAGVAAPPERPRRGGGQQHRRAAVQPGHRPAGRGQAARHDPPVHAQRQAAVLGADAVADAVVIGR